MRVILTKNVWHGYYRLSGSVGTYVGVSTRHVVEPFNNHSGTVHILLIDGEQIPVWEDEFEYIDED
jgi:hypothetical protein